MNIPFCVFACSLHFALHLRPTWPKKFEPNWQKFQSRTYPAWYFFVVRKLKPFEHNPLRIGILGCKKFAVKNSKCTRPERQTWFHDIPHGWFMYIILVVVASIFYFHPYLGRWIHFDQHIFQLGWNHQPAIPSVNACFVVFFGKGRRALVPCWWIFWELVTFCGTKGFVCTCCAKL